MTDKQSKVMKPRRIDWLALEMQLRDILRQVENGTIKHFDALRAMDDTIADVTGRGNELGEPFV